MSDDLEKKEGEVKIPSSEDLLTGDVIKEPDVKAVTTPEVDAEEILAKQSGWVPEEEWKGNPKEWRPAKEFNERGELLTRIKSQSRELSNLKQAMEFLTSQQKKQFQAGYEKAIVDLKAARTEALKEGDLVRAQDLTDKIDEIKDEQRTHVETQKPVQSGPSETFKEWFSSNSWYTKDRVMTPFAEKEGEIYKREHPDSTEADMLAYVARAVRKEFPDKFVPKSGPSPDGEGRGTTVRKGTSTSDPFRGVEDGMTDEQRSIMRTILKTTKMKKEDYIKQFMS